VSRLIRIAKSGARQAPTLPEDAVTRTFGIFGMKDSGKTNTGRVLVEGIVATGGHVIVFDPVGVWWGATRAGEGPGIPGVVIGGEHGDVPLEETGARLIAELALSRQYKLIVVDMKLLRKGAQRRFLADCLEELYFHNRRPLAVIFEEADQTLPQNPRGMDPTLGRVLGAAEDIVKLGRSRGLGGALISQRLATVNKNVTEQIENLILLRLVGPNDLKAVKEWVQSNGDPAATQKVLDSIAKLEQGEAWMYSPGWLKLLERIRVRHARTLDSSATPTNEEAIEQEAAVRATVSLDDLRDQMAATIERAKQNDPKELQRRIEELQGEVAELHNSATDAEPEKIVVPDRELVAQLSEAAASMDAAVESLRLERDGMAEDARSHADMLQGTVSDLDGVLGGASTLLEQAHAQLDAVGALPAKGLSASAVAREIIERTPAVRGPGASPAPGSMIEDRPRRSLPEEGRARGGGTPYPPASNGRVSGPQQRLLDTIAWFESIGVLAPRRAPLAMMAGVSSKSSGFRANLSALSSAGLIEYPDSGRVTYTALGREHTRPPASPGSEAELQEGVIRMVSGPQGVLLRELIAAYPSDLDRETLAARAGVSPASSGFRANLSALSSLELITYPGRGYVAASELLFIRR
jgi:uncharacterized protein